MRIRPFPVSDPASTAEDRLAGLRLPSIHPTTDAVLETGLRKRLRRSELPEGALGRLESLVLQLARIQSASPLPFDLLAFDSPQLVVFAADHGIADEGVSMFAQSATRQRVQQMLQGLAPTNAMADLQGFDLTVVDAGVATPLHTERGNKTRVPLQLRKIGYATRNMVLSPAMSVAQAVSAIHAGMDVVHHLPGNVVALGDVGVGSTSCAALLLSRLCGVPLADACGRGSGLDDAQLQNKLEKLFAAATRHRRATAPLDALAAMGGFEIAMMVGAMLQAAAERRVVLVDGFVAGAAALVARGLVPAVTDYLVFTHRSAEPGHRLLLIHLQAQPLLDMELRMGQGIGALMAWPLLLSAQRLLEH
jgi:nicotinate-nucleotide--dimethylbenzimidazole phosphoribosyltransferase